MHGSSFFIAFAAFVQLSVAFDFGFLYLFKNNRSIFKSIFDHVRKGIPFSWVMGFASDQVKLLKPKSVPEEVNQLRARVSKRKDELMSPANHEYMCDYMAATGVVSGLYSLLWLLLVPWSYSHLSNPNDLYLTLSVCTMIAELILVFHIFYRKRRSNGTQKTRAAMVLHSTLLLVVCCGAGLLMLVKGWVIGTSIPFHTLFLLSLVVTISSVLFYLFHLLVTVFCRICKSVGLFREAWKLRGIRLKLSQTH